MASTADREKALETALAQIDRQFGKGAIMRLGSEERAKVAVIPTGSIALDVALGVGGLPRGRIIEIYGPESSGKTTLTLHAIANVQSTGGTAAFIDAVDQLGAKRRAVVCRELTKTHEEIRRGTLAELAEWAAEGVLGEITVVLAGATPQADVGSLVAEVEALAEGGMRVKDACATVLGARPGAPSRRELYDAVLRARESGNGPS